MTPIFIDMLFSAPAPEGHPIEIGLVLGDGTRHCYLVAPARSWRRWDPETEQAHGLSRELLEAHGRPVGDLAWRLDALLQRRVVLGLDPERLRQGMDLLFDAAHLRRRFRVEGPLERLAPEQREAWETACREVAAELAGTRRRASQRARVLQEAWKRLTRGGRVAA